MADVDEIRRVITNEILRTQEVITSYVENKLAELDETIDEILIELASDVVVA